MASSEPAMRRNLVHQKMSPPKVNRRLARRSRVATDKLDEVVAFPEACQRAVSALRAASQGLQILLESKNCDSSRTASTKNTALPEAAALVPADRRARPRSGRRSRPLPAAQKPKHSATLASSLKRKAAAALLPVGSQSRVRRKVETMTQTGDSVVKPRREPRKTANRDATKNLDAKPGKPGINGCRLAESRAAWILEQHARLGRKITDTDMVGVLDAWSFRENKARTNVIPQGTKFVHSEMLGLVRIRAFSKYVVAKPTHRFPLVTRLLCRFLEDNPPAGLNHRMRFPFSTICINRNYAAKRHRDRNNMGMSIVRAFGNFTGGRLRYWPDDPGASMAPDPETLDAKNGVPLIVKGRSVVVDSTKAHEVEPFSGNRYSLVYFTIPNFQKCSQEARDFLCKECEVPLPKNPVEDQETWRHASAGRTAGGRSVRQRPPWQKEKRQKTQQLRDQKGEQLR